MDIQFSFTPADATAALALLEGFLVPHLVAALLSRLEGDQRQWASVARYGLVVLVSLAAGFLTVYATGDLSRGPVSVVQAAGLVAAASVAWYEGRLKGRKNPLQ